MTAISRRHLLGFGAGLAGLAIAPGCARHRASPPLAPPPPLGIRPDLRPHVASHWIARGEEANAYPQFKRMVEAATNFAWLSRGDSVLIKISLNTAQPYPMTTDPWSAWALITLLKEKGAGTVYVGDQCGMGSVVLTDERQRGSSRKCCERAGTLAAIEQAGGTPVFFEELGWDAAIETWPSGEHHWTDPLIIPSFVEQVDHIVYLPRVGSHSLADCSLGLKISVGWMRNDARFFFHAGGDRFCALYDEVNDVPPIASRLRLVVTSGREVLTTIGPDLGHVVKPDHGLVMASEDLLSSELLAYAWLLHNRWNHTYPQRGSLDRTVADMRSDFNRLVSNAIRPRGDRREVPDIPDFRGGSVYEHPAIVNRMQRLGGRPSAVQWEGTGGGGDADVTALLSSMISPV
jgi:uncharacterized protein (DUF362 family)